MTTTLKMYSSLLDKGFIQKLVQSDLDFSKLTFAETSVYLPEIKEAIKHFLSDNVVIDSRIALLYPSLIQESKLELLQEGLFQACLEANHSFIKVFAKNVTEPRDLTKAWHKLKFCLNTNFSLEALLACIKHLPLSDPSLVLLDRLYLDLKNKIGKATLNGLRKEIFDWIHDKIKHAASKDNQAIALNLVLDPIDPPISTFLAPVHELQSWTPEPPLVGSLPVHASVKSLDALSILFNCLTSSVFIDLYKQRLYKEIISKSTNIKQEYHQFLLLAKYLPKHEHMHIEVMLYDWARSKRTGFLIKASAYWPAKDETLDKDFPWELPCPQVRQELINVFKKSSLLNHYPNSKDMSLRWCPEDERAHVEIFLGDGTRKDIWCSAREYSFLVYELSNQGDKPFPIDEKFEKEIEFWLNQDVIERLYTNEKTASPLYRTK